MKEVKFLVFLIFTLSLSLADETPQEVASRVERRLFSLQSLQANFEQTYYSASVSKPLQEKGILYFKKPDWMRWEYKDPEKKIIIYGDGNFLSYFPEENQLIRTSLANEPNASEVLSLLSGQRKLEEYYSIESNPFPSPEKNVAQIKLTPKAEGEYSHILLEIDRKTWLLVRAIFFDWAGNKNELHFSQIKTNTSFPKKIFELKVPPDCEIIEDVGPKRK